MRSSILTTVLNPAEPAALLPIPNDPLLAAAAQREEVERRLSALRRLNKTASLDQGASMEHPEPREVANHSSAREPHLNLEPLRSESFSLDENTRSQQSTAWENATTTAQDVAAQTVSTVKRVASAASSAVFGDSATSSTANGDTKYQEEHSLEGFGSMVQAGSGPESKDSSVKGHHQENTAVVATDRNRSFNSHHSEPPVSMHAPFTQNEEEIRPRPGITHVSLHKTSVSPANVITTYPAEHALPSSRHTIASGKKPGPTTAERLGVNSASSGGRKEVSVEPLTPRELAEREWAQRAPPRRRRSEERIRQEGEKGKSPRSAAEALGGRISGEGTDEIGFLR